MAFIVDTYNKYDGWDREHSVYKFEINGQWYAIKEVMLFWGLPQFPIQVDGEKNPKTYQIYGTMEEAKKFVEYMKKLAR